MPTHTLGTSDEYEPYHSARWRGRIAAAWQRELGDADPLQWYLSHPHQPVRRRPGGHTWRVRIEGAELYVKHISACYRTEQEGGWKAGKRLRWALRRSPAMRLLRITQAMRSRGLAVPRIVHVAYRGAGLSREELVVTEAVAGKSLMRKAAGQPGELPALLELVAEKVFEMHQAGVVHGHLLPGHMLITDDGRDVVFIDNDENRLRRRPASWSDRMRNLGQLAHQVSPIYRQWSPFFRAYFQRAGLPPRRWRPMLATLLQQARERGRHSGRSRLERGRAARKRIAQIAARAAPVS